MQLKPPGRDNTTRGGDRAPIAEYLRGYSVRMSSHSDVAKLTPANLSTLKGTPFRPFSP
jgi:hypothetical protein